MGASIGRWAKVTARRAAAVSGMLVLVAVAARAQLVDETTAPNAAGEGIHKSLAQEIGGGRGDRSTPDTSSFLIARDPYRAIRRGRQLRSCDRTPTGPLQWQRGHESLQRTLESTAGCLDQLVITRKTSALVRVVETRGIEPLTPALQRRCSAN